MNIQEPRTVLLGPYGDKRMPRCQWHFRGITTDRLNERYGCFASQICESGPQHTLTENQNKVAETSIRVALKSHKFFQDIVTLVLLYIVGVVQHYNKSSSRLKRDVLGV